jgi:hypothetical protein
MQVTVNALYLKGVWRIQWMEYWQSLGVSNTYQLTGRQLTEIPRAITRMMHVLNDLVGEPTVHAWSLQIMDDYNDGRRA